MSAEDRGTERVHSARRPTLREVAALSGVSLRTTKKVLGGSDAEPVAEPTRAKVLVAAEELGYRRNALASALSRVRRENVGVVYSEVTAAYYPEVEKGFRQCAAELADYGLDIVFAKGLDTSAEKQSAQLDAMVVDPAIDAVVLQPVSADAVDPAISRLVDAGKPVITFGSDAPASRRAAFIGPDPYRAGRIGGEVLTAYLGHRGHVAVLSRGADHMQTRGRVRGFVDRVNQHSPLVRVTEVTIEDSADTYETMRRALSRPDVTGAFSTYADSVVAARVLADLGRRDVVLVGFDSSEQAVALMRAGFLHVILEQHPERIAYQALKAMFELRYHGVVPEPVTHTDVSIVTSECLPPESP